MIVVDASVAVKWVVAEPGHEAALGVVGLTDELVAPDVVLAEVANVLGKKVTRGELTRDHAVAGLARIESALTEIIPSAELVRDALLLGTSLNHSAYDCFYLAAAIGRGVLVSADEKFVRKCRAKGFGPFVSMPEDTAINFALHRATALEKEKLLEDVSRLTSLIEETTEGLFKGRSKPSEVQGLRLRKTGDARETFDSPAFRRLAERLSHLSKDDLRLLLALGWLGHRGDRAGDFPQLYEQAEFLAAEGFEEHKAYITSRVKFAERGLSILKSWAT